ncbi:MAG TPA: DUF4097 family beta strand repeat-containing protein [Blastocatellia bacterium]|nr:DUF4097 family beta strand repeat-containing protein [Blastocatellia bacterium]
MDKALIYLTGLLLICLAAASASAQDFQKRYQIGPGGEVRVHSSSGNVHVSGYDGQDIVVTAYKEGRDRDWVSIADHSDASHIDISSEHPRRNNVHASVRFEVEVPRSQTYEFSNISTSSGDVRVSSITGKLIAHSSSGNVTVADVSGAVNATSSSGNVSVTNAQGDVNANSSSGNVGVNNARGEVSARTSSGDVEVRISQLKPGASYDFGTSSGNVTVSVPAALDAEVSMSTSSGSVNCDFPITVQGKLSPHRIHGVIGGGSGKIRMESSSGNVTLRRI